MKTIIAFILNIILSALAVSLTAYLLPNAGISGWKPALLVALVLAFINYFIKPIINFFTLPINILTLGLFSVVVNALFILLTAKVVPGFVLDGFLPALYFSVVYSITSFLFKKVAN